MEAPPILHRPGPPSPDELLPRLLAAWALLEYRHRRRLTREAESLAGTLPMMHRSTLPAVVPGEGGWIPVALAASMIGVAVDTLRGWILSGKVRPGKAERIGNSLRFDPAEVERLKQEREGGKR